MNEPWREDFTKSQKDFFKIVYPQINSWFGDHEIISIETLKDEKISRLFDTRSSIDYFVLANENGIRGLSSRIQWETNWKTFTIRLERDSGTKTEYEKLCNAIENDWIYPYYFSQSYIKENILLGTALTQTKNLIQYIKNKEGVYGIDYGIRSVNSRGGASFYWVNWYSLNEKHPIKIYEA